MESNFFTKPCDHATLALSIRHALQRKDLIQHTRRLLRTVRRQAAALQDQPVNASDHAPTEARMIELEDVPVDLDALLQEVQTELNAAEARLMKSRC